MPKMTAQDAYGDTGIWCWIDDTDFQLSYFWIHVSALCERSHVRIRRMWNQTWSRLVCVCAPARVHTHTERERERGIPEVVSIARMRIYLY